MYNWEIFDAMPEGFIIDKTAGSPVPNTIFITNGKSVFTGQVRALLRVKPQQPEQIEYKVDLLKVEKPIQPQLYPAKTVNQLARAKFKEKLLQEILFDLQVCEIENWDKLEYINELKQLINDIKR